MRKIAVAVMLAFSTPAFCAQETYPSSLDSRVRQVTYNAQDVVEIPIVPGKATLIQFEEGENFMIAPALGDPDAVLMKYSHNVIWVKPKTAGGSNLSIVTDRRTYNIDLCYTTSQRKAVYQVTFRFPDTEARKLRERAEASTVKSKMEDHYAAYNLSYTKAGDMSISPVNVWDDGVQTWFKFPGGSDVPVIYAVDATGAETLVNRSMKGSEIVVVHKVNPRWTLRSGEQALAIFNDAFAPVSSPSGTRSPNVERVLKQEVAQ